MLRRFIYLQSSGLYMKWVTHLFTPHTAILAVFWLAPCQMSADDTAFFDEHSANESKLRKQYFLNLRTKIRLTGFNDVKRDVAQRVISITLQLRMAGRVGLMSLATDCPMTRSPKEATCGMDLKLTLWTSRL